MNSHYAFLRQACIATALLGLALTSDVAVAKEPAEKSIIKNAQKGAILGCITSAGPFELLLSDREFRLKLPPVIRLGDARGEVSSSNTNLRWTVYGASTLSPEAQVEVRDDDTKLYVYFTGPTGAVLPTTAVGLVLFHEGKPDQYLPCLTEAKREWLIWLLRQTPPAGIGRAAESAHRRLFPAMPAEFIAECYELHGTEHYDKFCKANPTR